MADALSFIQLNFGGNIGCVVHNNLPKSSGENNFGPFVQVVNSRRLSKCQKGDIQRSTFPCPLRPFTLRRLSPVLQRNRVLAKVSFLVANSLPVTSHQWRSGRATLPIRTIMKIFMVTSKFAMANFQIEWAGINAELTPAVDFN